MYYVYLLQSTAKLYVGMTSDLKKRIRQHNAGESTYTKPYIPWQLIFYEAYTTRQDASRREKYLKTTQGKQAIKRMLKYYFQNQGSTTG